MYKNSVLTVSVGKDYYHQLTKNLIYSFLRHNKSGIKINVLTDKLSAFAEFEDNANVVLQKIVDSSDKSFTSKFNMYEQAIAENNLFIDCDCLVYQDLTFIFEAFSNSNFSTIGSLQTEGDFFCDIKSITNKFGVDSLPVFVGSIYFFKKNNTASQIFSQAKSLKTDYDSLGFIRLREKENEEPLFALAMVLNKEFPLHNEKIKADAMFYDQIDSNVIKGTNQLQLLKYDTKAKDIYLNSTGKNIPIIHFNASYTDGWNYRLEIFRIKNFRFLGLLTNPIGFLTIKYPAKIKIGMKSMFRPLFRLLMGTRSIKKSNRV